MCVVGKGKPEVFYILVNDVKYKVDTAIRCFELIFKLFHALDIEYPTESEHVWLFVQGVFFHLKTAKKCPSETAVEVDIKSHLQD